MNNSKHPLTRREFLNNGAAGVGLVSFASFAPNFLIDAARAQAPGTGKDSKILVVLQLAGGNDGLNTIIQHQDDAYYSRRPTIAQKDYHEMTDYLGMNKAMTELKAMYDEGDMATIMNVGYPNPNRSHFRATDIFHNGSKARTPTGWVGRYMDNACVGFDRSYPVAINMGESVPLTFASKRLHKVYSNSTGADDAIKAAAVDRKMLDDPATMALLKKTVKGSMKAENSLVSYLSSSYMDAFVEKEKMDAIMDGYNPDSPYPNSGLARSLKNVASFIAKGFPTRVYYTKTGGFDTHANQVARHGGNWTTISKAIAAFYKDLKAKGLDKQVVLMTFSEFGRRVDENGSQGTDHGTIAPMFAFGPGVNGGVYGKSAYNIGEVGGDLPWNDKATDFRAVYSTVIQNWLGADPSKLFDKTYKQPGKFDHNGEGGGTVSDVGETFV